MSTFVLPREFFCRVFDDGFPVKTPIAPNYTPDRDREILLGLVRTFRPKVFLEIGVNEGCTAKFLLDECPFIDEYWGIDVPPDFSMAIDWQKGEAPKDIGHHARDDVRFHALLVENGTQQLVEDKDYHMHYDNTFDFCFIDADHSYEGVKRDSLLARRLVRKGGILAWHDYGVKGLGITQYIDEWNADHGNHIVGVTFTSMCFEITR